MMRKGQVPSKASLFSQPKDAGTPTSLQRPIRLSGGRILPDGVQEDPLNLFYQLEFLFLTTHREVNGKPQQAAIQSLSTNEQKDILSRICAHQLFFPFPSSQELQRASTQDLWRQPAHRHQLVTRENTVVNTQPSHRRQTRAAK